MDPGGQASGWMRNRRSAPATRKPRRLPKRLWMPALAGLLAATWVFFLPLIAVREIGRLTGARASLGSWSFSPFSGTLTLERLRLDNPPGFVEPGALDLTRLVLEFEPGSLLSPTARVHSATIEVASCTIVGAADAATNWTTMAKSARSRLRERDVSWLLAPLALVSARDAAIERLDVSVERVRAVNVTRRGQRSANLRVRFHDQSGGFRTLRAAWDQVGLTAFSEIARVAIETDNREAVRVLSGLARELGANPRQGNAAGKRLLEEVWPQEARATDRP